MVIPVGSILDRVPAAERSALAAGQVQSDEALYWQAKAERIAVAHADGDTVWHRWVPTHAQFATPVVLFHGGSGSWTHWVRNIAPLLEAGHTVWAADLPGFGASDGVAGSVDADTMLPALAHAMEQLFVQQPVRLVGFSFGGMTAAMLAAHAPHLLAQLVLVGAPGMGLRQEHPFRLRGWRHMSDADQQIETHAFNLGTLMLRNPDLIDRNALALHVHNVQRDRLPRRRLSATPIVRTSLASVQCPVSAIYGAYDVLYVGLMEALEHGFREAAADLRAFVLIADAGHWVQYEQPQVFNAELLRQLALPLPQSL